MWFCCHCRHGRRGHHRGGDQEEQRPEATDPKGLQGSLWQGTAASIPPCFLLTTSCPLPHGDQPLTERNPAQGAVGSWGTLTCPDMIPLRETVVTAASHSGCPTSPSESVLSPSLAPFSAPHRGLQSHLNMTLNCPKGFHRCLQSLYSPTPFFLSCWLN